MFVRPIPLKLLPHECVLKKPKTEGLYGGYEQPVALRNVRVEENRKARCNNGNEGYRECLVLYYDTANSLPKNVPIDTGDIVEYGGRICRVETVRYVMAADRVHHIRAVLV